MSIVVGIGKDCERNGAFPWYGPFYIYNSTKDKKRLGKRVVYPVFPRFQAGCQGRMEIWVCRNILGLWHPEIEV